MPAQEPILSRANTPKLSDMYAHLLIHAPNMEVENLKREIAKTAYEFITRNKIDPGLKRLLIEKVDDVCSTDHPSTIAEALSNMCLWLDKLPALPTGYTFPVIPGTEHGEVDKKGKDIIDALRFSYGVKFFDMQRVNTKFRIYVGPHRKMMPYMIARGMAVEFDQYVQVWADGPKGGRISWIDTQKDLISIYHPHVINAGSVYLSVYEVLPHLKGV